MGRKCGTCIGEVTCPNDATRAFLTWTHPVRTKSWNRVLTPQEVKDVYNAAVGSRNPEVGELHGVWRVEYACDDHSSEYWHVADLDAGAAKELTLEEAMVADVLTA